MAGAFYFLKAAVTLRSWVMLTVQGLAVPVHSLLQ